MLSMTLKNLHSEQNHQSYWFESSEFCRARIWHQAGRLRV